MIGGHLDETTPASHDIARTHRRFYLSLLLRDLINESPVHKVATKYHAPRGAVQQLASTARGFAATSAIYCRVMGWSGLAVLLDHYAERLDLGVKDDLVDLARLPFVKSATARVFHENGLRNVEMVAKEGKEKIMEILWSAQPRRLQILAEKDEKMRARVMERAAIVVRAAQRLWDAECLVELDE